MTDETPDPREAMEGLVPFDSFDGDRPRYAYPSGSGDYYLSLVEGCAEVLQASSDGPLTARLAELQPGQGFDV